MQKHLYFICPTDHLESVINKKFKQENYYCTSLGNSIAFDVEMIRQLNTLIEIKQIREIIFVLSDDNPVVMDALENQDFINVRGLDSFYDEIKKEKYQSEALWQTNLSKFLMISYYLNKKIKELQGKLSNLHNDPIIINGKIYMTDENNFRDIYSQLICVKKHYFN